MNEQLRLLVELQKLDSIIIALNSTIKSIPLKISTAEKLLKEAQSAHDAVRKELEAAEKKKKDAERELDEINDRAEKMRSRTKEIRDNVAYQAHLKEIEQVEKGRFAIEDRILEQMEAMESIGVRIKEAKAALDKEKEKVDETKKVLEAEVTRAETELSSLKAKRKDYTGGIEKEWYDQYMEILKIRDGLAVVKVADEICTGCYMNIMPQLCVEIQKDIDIYACPQCRRILYREPPAEQAG